MPRQGMGIYTAQPGTPDRGATLLLVMSAPRPANKLAPQQSWRPAVDEADAASTATATR